MNISIIQPNTELLPQTAATCTFGAEYISIEAYQLNGLVVGTRCQQVACGVPGSTVDGSLVMLHVLVNNAGFMGHMVFPANNNQFICYVPVNNAGSMPHVIFPVHNNQFVCHVPVNNAGFQNYVVFTVHNNGFIMSCACEQCWLCEPWGLPCTQWIHMSYACEQHWLRGVCGLPCTQQIHTCVPVSNTGFIRLWTVLASCACEQHWLEVSENSTGFMCLLMFVS